MTLAMPIHSSFSGPRTFAYSDVGNYAVCQRAQGMAHLRKSISLGAGIEAATQELRNLVGECSSSGWDGYEAAPVIEETAFHAEQFLNSLPLGIAAPSVGAEPDGQITFEWYRTQRYILSVSVSPEGELHYAALLGGSEKYGTELFFGDIPNDILALVQRVQC